MLSFYRLLVESTNQIGTMLEKWLEDPYDPVVTLPFADLLEEAGMPIFQAMRRVMREGKRRNICQYIRVVMQQLRRATR